jgi:polyhydroxyalkanoate synthesis regulator phasin
MTNGFGPTIENAKKQQAYIDSLKQQFGEMTPVDQSLREKSVNIATDVIGALPFGGGGDYRDRQIAKSLFGDYYADSIADSIGVLDFTPLGLIYGVDEALREYGEAEKATDYILPTVGLGLSALEALPLTEVATRPLRRFLSNLANKTSSAPTDISRRALLKGAVAAPVAAGALSNIPLGKVVDEVVPVVKETAPVLKKAKNIKSMLRLTDLPQMKKSLIKFEAEGLGIELSDLSEEFGREIKSFDDLNSKEIDKVFEDNFLDPATTDSDSFEDDMRQQIQEALDDFQLSSKSFVEGTEKLTTDEKFSSPVGELLEDFIEEMKKSGYSNEEISDVIDNSLDDLFNRATSLDELDDEMM